jgi:iron-sulfur cluster assembly protein
VLPGGCSGFRYSLNIESSRRPMTSSSKSAGVRLFVDEFSAQYLNGTVIDYKKQLPGIRFRVRESETRPAVVAADRRSRSEH